MPLRELGRLFIVFGLLLAAIGVFLLLGAPLPFRLGRLPGDIVYRGRHTTIFFPVVTSIVLSIALTLLLWLASMFRR